MIDYEYVNGTHKLRCESGSKEHDEIIYIARRYLAQADVERRLSQVCPADERSLRLLRAKIAIGSAADWMRRAKPGSAWKE